MGRMISFLAAVFLLILVWAGHYYPASPLFWVSSNTPALMILRGALAIILLWFFVYTPKSKWLRVPIGLATLVLTTWLADTAYQGSMGAIDSITLLAATTAVLIALLESKPKNEAFRLALALGVATYWASDKILTASVWVFQLGWLLLTDIDLSLEEYYRRLNGESTGLPRRHQPHHA